MRTLLTTTVLTLLFSASVFGQAVAGLGAVTGTVRDASGAAVPGASVVIVNEAKGIRRAMDTTDAGLFSAPALTPSSGYDITVSKSGFAN